LKTTYSLLSGSLSLSVNTSQDIQLHLPSLTVQGPGLALSDVCLPSSLCSTLSRGPATFCSYPACSKPVFRECSVEVVEKDVQRTFLGTGEVELTSILATRFYCSSACYINYSTRAMFPWEKELLRRGIVWM
jgi:hypothetical protein